MRIKWLASLAAVLALTSLLAQAVPANAAKTKKTELLVSAAASLKDSLGDIEKQYEKTHANIDLTFNFGSSGTLQKQIEQGAPADLFFSAGQKQMDALKKEELVDTSATILRNSLVMIVSSDSDLAFTTVKELTAKSIKKVAIGQPESVPAGQYAKETLTARKTWDALQDKLVYAKDVRQVLNYVETGNADAGFVYRTDALTSRKARIAINVDARAHAPIVYPAGIVKATEHPAEAKAFFAYLKTKEAAAVFAKYGFITD
ncbi:molybdate transport system substrate-binding protein [Paenibacillus methanolicus]|uniref:Molybdate transport system substrate-binding protein n=2 Tax=Paenibacillus methanolicus TaxID=582686 RepID=A0A5S5CJF9_9BACL|nr:molybdate ABC transporter substrate-binding protein [Paenibacillus methanolicus]TYP78153.1 molybdate transport system substrate-binding protein [Paenibacillus methanolicus]